MSRKSRHGRRSKHHHKHRYSEICDSSTSSDSFYSLYEMFGAEEFMSMEEAYLTDSEDEKSVDSATEDTKPPTLSSELLISIPAIHGKRVFSVL